MMPTPKKEADKKRRPTRPKNGGARALFYPKN